MEADKLLQDFMDWIEDDVSVSAVHISLYVSLLLQWQLNNHTNPVVICRDKMMSLAKISARGTYYKALDHLQEMGFIKYSPSMNQFNHTCVYIQDLSRKLKEYQFR